MRLAWGSKVHQQHPLAPLLQAVAQVVSGSGLGYPALLVDDGDDPVFLHIGCSFQSSVVCPAVKGA